PQPPTLRSCPTRRSSDLLQRKATGSIVLNGDEILGDSVREVLDAGLGFVPEDRNVDGLVGSYTIAENLMLDRYLGEPFVRMGTIDRKSTRLNSSHVKISY